MAAHARLKNEFTEDEKYHNLIRWLILFYHRVMCPKDADRVADSADQSSLRSSLT